MALIVLLFVGLLAQRRLTMGPATGLGVHDGRLAACPASPNCVSSFAEDDEHRVEPIELTGDPSEALARLRAILERTPRTRVVDAAEGYLHAEAKTFVWGYVDDLEVLVDAEAGKIHFRSASRAGYSDLGVNRQRVGELVEAFSDSAR